MNLLVDEFEVEEVPFVVLLGSDEYLFSILWLEVFYPLILACRSLDESHAKVRCDCCALPAIVGVYLASSCNFV